MRTRSRAEESRTRAGMAQDYETMVLIRRFEEAAERQYKADRIGGYCHLSSGQEATSVGVARAMSSDDLLVTGYRCHGFALARGTPPESVMAELFGRTPGCANGRGGSMHLLDVERGYFGGWGIVAGQLPVATGLALGLVRQDRPGAVVCELGDGGVNMGAWHECLNLASLWKLPILFVVVNNFYGMGTSVDRASAEPQVHKRAAAHQIHGEAVDGDELGAVVAAAHRLLARARRERLPAVLEAVTYRHRGHSVADPGLAYRSRKEIDAARAADPITRVREELIRAGVSAEALELAGDRAAKRVELAVAFAEEAPEPDVGDLAMGTYSKDAQEQFERMLPGSPFGEADLVFAAGIGR